MNDDSARARAIRRWLADRCTLAMSQVLDEAAARAHIHAPCTDHLRMADGQHERARALEVRRWLAARCSAMVSEALFAAHQEGPASPAAADRASTAHWPGADATRRGSPRPAFAEEFSGGAAGAGLMELEREDVQMVRLFETVPQCVPWLPPAKQSLPGTHLLSCIIMRC